MPKGIKYYEGGSRPRIPGLDYYMVSEKVRKEVIANTIIMEAEQAKREGYTAVSLRSLCNSKGWRWGDCKEVARRLYRERLVNIREVAGRYVPLRSDIYVWPIPEAHEVDLRHALAFEIIVFHRIHPRIREKWGLTEEAIDKIMRGEAHGTDE